MKTSAHSPTPAVLAQPSRHVKGRRPRLRHGSVDRVKTVQSRAEQKTGAYKRLEVFLGVEAAIALRQLMREGRSAREVVETLLLAEKQRRKEQLSP